MTFSGDRTPPEERRSINLRLTEELNTRLGLNLTDAFCGFKAYRVSSLQYLPTTENGYAMPLELWVRAAVAELSILELPIPLIYLEEKRSFGGKLDDGQTRMRYYHRVLAESICRLSCECGDDLPAPLCGDPTE
jgi:dolichol-phosphate mannosyltransferase